MTQLPQILALAVWSVVIVYATRLFLVRMLEKFVSRTAAFIIVYTFFAASLFITMIWLGLKEFGMGNPDKDQWSYKLTYAFFFLSPFGTPLLIGAPVSLVVDVTRALWGRRKRKPI